MSLAGDEADMAMSMNRWYVPFASRKSAAHRGKSREWNVSKQQWNLCQHEATVGNFNIQARVKCCSGEPGLNQAELQVLPCAAEV